MPGTSGGIGIQSAPFLGASAHRPLLAVNEDARDALVNDPSLTPSRTLMKKYCYLVPAVCALLGLSNVAHAVNIDINVGTPAPVYVAPPPVYVAPPAQVVMVPGWHGDRYYDGHRYWSRHDWEAHQHDEHDDHHHHEDDRYHCPPGHAKKGEC
jgi:hypothetical protein